MLNIFGYLPNFTNWWAFFIFLPGIGTFSAAINAYRRNEGQWSAEVAGLLVASLFFVGVTAVFLFELNFTWILPIFLIAAGILMLFRPIIGQNS